MSFTLGRGCPMFQVFDMPTSLAFYRDGLGFTVASTDAAADGDRCDWVLLQREDAVLMLNTAYEIHERPASAAPERHAAHGDTIVYFGCADVDAVYAHCRRNGWAVEPPHVTHYNMRQLYLHDPDGYGLCFQCPV